MNSFDYLLLLVGTNPLPNLVVSEYFLRNNLLLKEIFLIYSEKTPLHDGTYEEAKRLKQIIREKYPKVKIKEIALSNINQAKIIKREIREKFIAKTTNNTTVHLNYTGGTKAMGIHVYNALKDAQISASYSYLDAREYVIIDDDRGKISTDLRESINITFDEMIALHGFQRVNNSFDTSAFVNTLKMFKRFIDEDRIGEFFKGYKREIFLDKSNNLATKLKGLTDNFANNNLDKTTINGAFLEIVKTLPEEYQLFDDHGKFQTPKDENIGKSLRYIDGVWLEDYIYHTLKECLPLKYVEKNWEIKKPQWTTQKFEIDVLLINGYQLIGISCTSASKKSICKSKGFEILLRCRQIGGDEAKAVLITRLKRDKAEELQEELIADTAGSQNILVLGHEDWKESILCQKIRKFII